MNIQVIVHNGRLFPENRRARRIAEALGFMAALVGLCGCVSEPTPRVTLEQSIATPTVVALAQNDRSASTARAALPVEAGQILRITGSGSAQGFGQDIFLDGSAVKNISNKIEILSNTDVLESRDSPMAIKPTEASIRTELKARFPAIEMNVATRPFANAYGPYGLALGRGPSEIRCIYAWQWIDDDPGLAKAGVSGPVSVRVTLCRKGQTFDEMASLIDRIAIGGMSPAPVLDTAVLPSNGRFVKAHVRHAQVAHRKPPRAASRAQTAIMRDQDAEGQRPVAMPDAASPRYMAPVPATPRGGVQPDLNDSSDAASASSALAPPLSQDLPPQAYLGPRAAGLKGATTPSAVLAQ